MATDVRNGRLSSRAFVGTVVALITLGAAGLFAAMVQAEETRGAAQLAEAELARTNLKIELERAIDAERAARILAEGALTSERQRLDDARRELEERCGREEGATGRPVQRPRPNAGQRPQAAGRDDDLDNVTELPPYVSDNSADGTIHLPSDGKPKPR